ncbi:MAG TPA: hypothetical protein VNQ57_00740 [Ureibacillus sp.]|nr:hypothetical protein [Ureibacillus sp.]
MVKTVSRGSYSKVSKRAADRKSLTPNEKVHEELISDFNIKKLLKKGDLLQVNENGVVNIDYSNPKHMKIAEDWLKD